MMTLSAPPPTPCPGATVRRKVTASGVIWLDGRSYYVSRRLAGRTIDVDVGGGKLVVDTMIPLRKEYSLPGLPTGAVRRARGWRAAEQAS